MKSPTKQKGKSQLPNATVRSAGLSKPEQGKNRLSEIEEDTRTLMRRLAETELVSTENDKRTTEQQRSLLLSLLDVTDAFDRVFGSINAKKDVCNSQMNIWVGNFRTVHRLLQKLLTEQGVTPIENLDQGFDPYWHEVETIVFDKAKPSGAIVEEVKRGYLWRNKELLRRARVVVVTHDSSVVSDIPEASSKAEDNQPPKR